ncbi:MAG: M1 family metallopeptidase [Flavisolibacter sp.]
MMHRLTLFFILLSLGAHAQTIDVQHYSFAIDLNDASDTITGRTTIQVRFLNETDRFYLDLGLFSGGTGMKVDKVTMSAPGGEQSLVFGPEGGGEQRLYISLPQPSRKEEEKTFTISYHGKPKDGLIISRNKFGDRTFFADNWPNRAHQWIPCNDRPDDKASFEFLVTAPAQYSVVSNGEKTEERMLGHDLKRTHWKEAVPLSTKVMVIGVARFGIREFSGGPAGIPVSGWLYPQDSSKGFYDYGVAPAILNYFSGYIGPFPYNKLANVQSTTIFGGMENASAIFYSEESVTGTRKWEDVMAHEIAHQWFGDMVSEKSFAHLWLSEGFATYMTDLYIEKNYGRDSAVRRLKKEREDVRHFAAATDRPVVDSTTDLMSLLNANSYQKGGWVLHMLRQELGDSLFRKTIQAYYQQYKGGNAETRDFEAVAEKVSGKDLKGFFDQWLYGPGIPELNISYSIRGKEVWIRIEQTQKSVFRFPLEVGMKDAQGKGLTRVLQVGDRVSSFRLNTGKNWKTLRFDPECHLLYGENHPPVEVAR